MVIEIVKPPKTAGTCPLKNRTDSHISAWCIARSSVTIQSSQPCPFLSKQKRPFSLALKTALQINLYSYSIDFWRVKYCIGCSCHRPLKRSLVRMAWCFIFIIKKLEPIWFRLSRSQICAVNTSRKKLNFLLVLILTRANRTVSSWSTANV